MKLTTTIRPKDTISVDNQGEYSVFDVRPNQFGGSDVITYSDDNGEHWTVNADRCAIVHEPF
jgi:hypothetical protein